MPKYIPPHRRRTEAEVQEDAASTDVPVAVQQTAWNALSRSIISIFNRLNTTNVEETTIELLRENIIRGRGLVAVAALRTQDLNPDLTPALVAVLSRLNKDCPIVVELICRRLVVEWTLAYRRKDWMRVENINKFLSWLYIFHVIQVGIIFEILLTLLTSERRSDEDIDLAAKLFEETFKAMGQRCRREFHTEVLQTFRDLLAMDDDDQRLSARSQAVLERCLKQVQAWEKVKDTESLIPESFIFFDLESEQTCHDLELGEKYPTEHQLDRFAVDPEYQENEDRYEVIRKNLLGEDWELELLEAHIADEEAEDEDEMVQEQNVEGKSNADVMSEAEALDRSKTMIDQNERKIRKEVYLAMRGSVRADEVVHKIIKSLVPNTERTVCFMIIEGCCEERAYKRIYEMTAERLCKTRIVFQTFFVEAFRERYLLAETLSVKQIEYTCALFAHLLRTESLYWSRCLCVLDILSNNESQRLFIQHLFRFLAEAMGMPSLVQRLQRDSETVSMTSRLFPVEELDDALLQKAINLFVAMDLGDLTAGLRAALEARQSSRKRPRQ